MRTAALYSIRYEVGDLRPTRMLLEDGVQLEKVDELLEKGVVSYSVLERPVSEAMNDCIKEALSGASVAPEDVDTVILVTESFANLFDGLHSGDPETDAFRLVRNHAFDFFSGLGISKASILCATYGGCTNVVQGLLLAQTLVEKGLSRYVLLVAAEKFRGAEARLMQEAVSIAGDGVAACIVAAADKDGAAGTPDAFRLDHVSIAPYKKFRPEGDMANLLLEMFRAMKNAAADTYEACEKQPGQFRWLVLGDYNKLTSITFSRLLGFAPESTCLENVGRMGHIPFDPLINLRYLQTAHHIGQGDSVLLFLCGPISCGSVALRAI